MPIVNAPLPDALIDRFRGDLESLTGPADRIGRIGVAVSGGADSTALLLLAHAALPGRVVAATVDHGLRAEAAAEATQVAEICKNLGIPHTTLTANSGTWKPGGNIQERARILRYSLLGAWAAEQGLTMIAVAHHRDDVAESLLMRAVRGAGLSGLSRMAPRCPLPHAQTDGITLLRPLLDWSRAELADIVAAAGITPIEDPSNRDDRYDRVRIRKLLAAEPLLDPAQLAKAAANLASANEAVRWMTDQAWRSRATVTENGEVLIDPGDLPYEIRRNLAIRAIRHFSPDWDGEAIDSMLDRLGTNSAAMMVNVRISLAPHDKTWWRFRIAPQRRDRR